MDPMEDMEGMEDSGSHEEPGPITVESSVGSVDFSSAEEITVQDPSAAETVAPVAAAAAAPVETAPAEPAPEPVAPEAAPELAAEEPKTDPSAAEASPAPGVDEDELLRMEEEVRREAAERRRRKQEASASPEPSETSAASTPPAESFVSMPAEDAFSLSEDSAAEDGPGAPQVKGWAGLGKEAGAPGGSVEDELRAEAERLAQLEIDAALAREQEALAAKALRTPAAVAPASRLGEEGFFDVEPPAAEDDAKASALAAAEAELSALRGEGEAPAAAAAEAAPPVVVAGGGSRHSPS